MRSRRTSTASCSASADCALALESETPLGVRDGAAQARFSLSEGASATFVLEHVAGAYEPHLHSAAQTRELAENDRRLLAALAVAVALHRTFGARWLTARR